MNGRELAFCAHYAVHRNAEEAAIEAGFSKNHARSHSYKILRRPHIQEQLNFMAMQVADKTVLDAVVVVNELGALALTRADEFLKFVDGRWIGKRPEELNDRQRACVRDIKTQDIWITDAENNRVYSHQEYRYVLKDSQGALYKLGDHFGVGGTIGDNSNNPFESMSQAQLEAVTIAMQNAMPKQVEGEVVSG